MKYDPFFYKKFKIKTKIKYMFDVNIEKKHQTSFHRAWKKFYKKSKNPVSKTREKQFETFFHKLKLNQSDESFCDKVSIKFIDRHMGYGVFAKEDIAKYTILNHYAGILKKDSSISEDNDSSFSFPDFDKFSIESQYQGNWTRFMNHLDETNVIAWEYYLPDGPRIVFTAGCQGIKKGNELVYSYGDIYWEEDELVS